MQAFPSISPIAPHAQAAITAAQNHHKWGRWTTLRYLARRGVPLSLFTLARVLEAARRAGL